MDFYKIKNWEEFQHYKDRSPPWIKLHRTLLADYQFLCLQDASKLHLMLIWLFASQSNNQIPDDPAFLQKALHLDKKPDLNLLEEQGFLIREQCASNALADCKQNAPLGEERRGEERGGKNGKRFMPPSLQQVSDYVSERGSGVDPEKFIDHYTANGWKVGRNAMKDWKAAVRTWEKTEIKKPKPRPFV